MKTLKRLLIVSLVFAAILSCRPGPAPLPTLTPVPPTQTPPAATPVPGVTPEATPVPVSLPSEREIHQNQLRATVQIIAMIEERGELQPIWTGSGSILSPDGLILTNAHVVSDPDPTYQPDALGVAITIHSDQPPELTYLAEVRAIDEQLDLAVIQIISDLNGQPVNASQLNLSYVALGDSDQLELGDALQILGYPGIGGETITFTEGSVSGFTRERSVEGRAWIKTDATIAGGNSGGMATDPNGELVGVPTEFGYGGADRFADCRPLADTNGDGVIDEDDNCIPLGGFINAIRPVNLARPLIEAARLGVAPKPGKGGGGPVTPPSGAARFYNLLFSPGVTDNDQPTQVVTQLPSGVTNIYAFWDYENIPDGANWEARWYHNDQLEENASWPAAPWQGGQAGNWWVSITNENGLADGTYRIELYVEGELQVEGTISVSGSATGPAITNLIFSNGVTSNDEPTNPTYLLPSGITDAYAFFDFQNMQDGMDWKRIWYYEGEELVSKSDTWAWGSEGSTWVSISAREPLEPGNYRLELFIEGDLGAASNFTIAGTEDQQAIGPVTFASGADAQGHPVSPGNSFPTGLEELHFFCDYAGMRDGLNFDEKWILDGAELTTFSWAWDAGVSGTFHDYIYLNSGEPLPDGEYRLELYVEGQQVQSAVAAVGSGTPVKPTPTPPPGGLTVQGHIRDADTGRGIPDAAYVVLNPGITVDSWDGSDAQVYTWAGTDRDGYFELPLSLERGQSYSIIVWAEGYTPVGGDNIPIGDDPSPLEVEVTLQKE